MSPDAVAVLARLADGRVGTVEGLARECNLSSSDLRLALAELARLGAPTDHSLGDGRVGLRWPLDLLDLDRLRSAGVPPGLDLSLVTVTGSTNDDLSREFGHRRALLAECQHGGRGRRGRVWLSPLAAGLWCSFGFEFERAPGPLGPLALIAGIAAAEALDDARIRLKWPNDLVAGGCKLGGVLVEIRSNGAYRTRAVIGIGINVRIPTDSARPDQPWTDLHRLRERPTEDAPAARNRLAARLLSRLDHACGAFNAAGFEPFRARWNALDDLRGRAVRVQLSGDQFAQGVARGVDPSGALRVELDDGTIRAFNAGDVSVRPR